MRNLKFRFWDKGFNKMLSRKPISDFFTHPEMTPLQYTGFKDKNGREIYEGDILSDYTKLNDGTMYKSHMQVFWCDNAGAWKLDNSYHQDKSSGDLLSEELFDFNYEVTGNIYEKI